MDGSLIANLYSMQSLIGCGTFGDVYAGVNTHTGEKVAIKVEENGSCLVEEYNIYKYVEGARGFPKMYYFGPYGNKLNVLVMERLGPSLMNLLEICNNKMSLKTVLMIAPQMIRRLESLHEAGFVHRDLKIDNFMMGVGKHFCNLYLIDLGLAQRYRDAVTNMHFPQTEAGYCGTYNYMPIDTHKQLSASRGDDLESLGYVLVHLLKGKLPWMGNWDDDSMKLHKLLYNQKLLLPISKLCEDLPKEFELYFNYCTALGFAETPNYKYLIKLFKKLFEKKKFKRDYCFDWMKRSKHSAKPEDSSVVVKNPLGTQEEKDEEAEEQVMEEVAEELKEDDN